MIICIVRYTLDVIHYSPRISKIQSVCCTCRQRLFATYLSCRNCLDNHNAFKLPSGRLQYNKELPPSRQGSIMIRSLNVNTDWFRVSLLGYGYLSLMLQAVQNDGEQKEGTLRCDLPIGLDIHQCHSIVQDPDYENTQ